MDTIDCIYCTQCTLLPFNCYSNTCLMFHLSTVRTATRSFLFLSFFLMTRRTLNFETSIEEICVRWERVACCTWRPLPVVHSLSLPWPQAPPETTRTPRQGASLITSESLPVSLDDLCPGLTPLICHFIPSALASLLANMSPGVLKPLHCLYA